MDPAFWHRVQFAFTATYHYLFPQLTMGLALVIVVMKTLGLRRGGDGWNRAAAFWTRIFGINFALGVVTGIPLEFQFGTNWGGLARYSGNVIGQTLAMEGVFAFFLESSFLALLVYGERRVGRIGHWLAAVALWAGSWLSGYFIVATNAFLQHPVGYAVAPDGSLQLASLGALLTSAWAVTQYAHTMLAAVVTGAFAVAAVGAYYTLRRIHADAARRFLAVALPVGFVAALLVAFPTGDRQAKLVAAHQPAALAAMEGRFETGPYAEITMIGQPNVAQRRIDNPIRVPGMLSFLAYGAFDLTVRGLADFPEDTWPDNIELLYYTFHIMVGLGTLLLSVMALTLLLHVRGRLVTNRPALWVLMLAFPFPYIANAAGWITAELGRQPWVVYGLLRTRDAASPLVHPGSALFSLIGFCGLYLALGLLFVLMVVREILHGPDAAAEGRGHV